jgi:hypothetical protein
VVRQADGRIISHFEPAEMRPTSLGKLSGVIRLDLQTAPPGDYELVMAFSDMVAGKMLQLKEPFSVQAEGTPRRAAAQH